MAVASGLTLREDVLALLAALLLLLRSGIIGRLLRRLDRGLCARLDGLFLEQLVVRASRFNDGAVTGSPCAAGTTGVWNRARERLNTPLGPRVLVHDHEATPMGMIRRDTSSHPHASQIQPRQLTQPILLPEHLRDDHRCTLTGLCFSASSRRVVPSTIASASPVTNRRPVSDAFGLGLAS